MIIIHTAEIRPSPHERIIEASLNKRDIDQEVQVWRVRYPGRKITYKTIVEEFER
jgi:hypothetical protein